MWITLPRWSTFLNKPEFICDKNTISHSTELQIFSNTSIVFQEFIDQISCESVYKDVEFNLPIDLHWKYHRTDFYNGHCSQYTFAVGSSDSGHFFKNLLNNSGDTSLQTSSKSMNINSPYHFEIKMHKNMLSDLWQCLIK